jgi:alkanesulfonate monooxygenase SsuD/methylene tetrahydromethanopterin reductase-like flavin-dependent oxidoreductase (luciferase family)
MDVGMAVIFQNPDHAGRTDYEVYKRDLAMGEMAVDLGFQSIWSIEHHFDGYTMCPDVMQMLTYFAGRCPSVDLGSMVVVLPWHNPLRVAEQISVLDHMCDGRFILGLGRGLAKAEYEGFGVDQNTARERFVESAEIILNGLESGFCEYNGQHIKQARVELRPRPYKSFKGRTYAAAVSPESFEIMARLGIGVLIIPQKPWDAMLKELGEYRAVYRQHNSGKDAPPPIVAQWIFCHEDAGRAEELAREYIGGYWRTVVKHYDIIGDQFSKLKGYESYRAWQETANRPGGVDEMLDFFLSLQCWGTPEQCYDKIADVMRRTGGGALTGVFSYAGMPWDLAEANMRLFAKEVMPELKKLEARPLLSLAAE